MEKKVKQTSHPSPGLVIKASTDILASHTEITAQLVRERLVQALKSEYSQARCSYPCSPEAPGCPRAGFAQLARQRVLQTASSPHPSRRHRTDPAWDRWWRSCSEVIILGGSEDKTSIAFLLLFTTLEIKVGGRKQFPHIAPKILFLVHNPVACTVALEKYFPKSAIILKMLAWR